MKNDSLTQKCVADFLAVRLANLDNACSEGGVCTYCAECFRKAKKYLQQCKTNGIEPDRESQDIFPESETPLWDLRDYIFDLVRELKALRPAFGEMPEFQALEAQAQIDMRAVRFVLNC